eukprot:3218274-Pyramimonas_sp.AAC.1
MPGPPPSAGLLASWGRCPQRRAEMLRCGASNGRSLLVVSAGFPPCAGTLAIWGQCPGGCIGPASVIGVPA